MHNIYLSHTIFDISRCFN